MSIQRKKFSIEVGGKTLTIELSSLAHQTNASLIATYGQTSVLVTVVMGHKDASVDYLPLRVDYEERFYAAGKIIGSRFIRREGRPSEEAVLTGRLVDRAIRPLFDQRLRREVQVVTTVLAYDEENDPDVVGLLAASIALGISDVPWNGPVAGVRIAKIGDQCRVNPSNSELLAQGFAFDAFVSGTRDAINMIELSGKETGEKDVLEGFAVAEKEINRLVEFQDSIIKEVGKKKIEVALREIDAALRATVEKFLSARLEEALYEKDKKEQVRRMHELREALMAHGVLEYGEDKFDEKAAMFVFDEAMDALVHRNILEKDRRPDGRRLDEVRALNGEVGLFARTHGSAVFMRGDTQSLAVVTLAPPGAEQTIETMEVTAKRRFLLHYNFPPYSVGEIGFFRGPGRREIGHGALAEKALKFLIPQKDEFPYTIRVVSEILSSNGSSSMATVCAGSLALMDAGVPIKKHVAGIAMGLMSDGKGTYKILTDIQGPEDHYGDMDLKVAGTEDGVTAVQMDIKVHGLSLEILEKAFVDAKKARLIIIAYLKSVLPERREKISPFAPGIIFLKINPEKIGLVIGPGGKMINGLIKKHGLVSIDIDEDGSVFISSQNMESAQNALREIEALTKEFKVGDTIEGEVIKVLEFGAIVDLGGGRDGMIHVSEFKNGFVKNINDVVKIGDFVRAKIIRAEEGKVALSVKQLQ